VSRIDSDALVVRTVELGEADVIATLFTEQVGKISAIVRGARKGSRRIGGALEPVHTIGVLLEDRGAELATLKEARIVRTRPRVTADLDALDAAGTILRWARHLFPPRTPEPAGWRVLIDLLDVLEEGLRSPRKELASAGLALLAAVGYGLELERCVGCARPCPTGKAAYIDPARGGLVCRSCRAGGSAASGAPGRESSPPASSALSQRGQHLTVLSVAERDGLRALAAGRAQDASVKQADTVLTLIDRALAAHTGLEHRWR
jgi:DNA repair protein RecO (recombination protein O)